MTTNEQVIQQIKELISLLTKQTQELSVGSKAFNENTKIINAYANGLRALTGEAKTSARELRTLETQAARLAQELAKPATERTPNYRSRFSGIRVRTASLPQTGASGFDFTEFDKAANQSAKVFSREGNDQLAESQKKVARATTMSKEAMAAWREEQKKAREVARALVKELEAQEKEQARIARNRRIGEGLPGGQKAAQNLYTVAGKIDPNFNAESLRRIQTEPTTGISTANFQYTTAEGVIKGTTLTVDKFGKVLVDTQKRFRSFGSAISRDIGEVLKWSIAVGAVYGPIQKLGELLQTAVENETALAEVTTTLGNSTKSMVEIFNAANDVAQEVGENTNDVIKAYNMAYRATGGIIPETARFATTNRLLTDALTLSKLSALDEAEAIDTLSAALKQVAQPGESLEQTLSRGSELLDKWVAVSKVANVDLATLATGFSVVGDAADAAGIETDKLNAVIATISETTSMSGKEVANTAKAMIAGFQSDNAVKELNALGIAMLDSEGKARNFLEISEQIASMQAKGLISEEQFSKLTLAIGGGTRRQASVSTFISNLGKIEDITNASKNAASGGAMNALGKQMDTVSTASTKLGNAFQGLAEALGESGGILDLTKNFLTVLASLTSGITDLMNVAGKAGPVLLTSFAALAILKGQGPAFKDKALGGIQSSAMNLYSSLNPRAAEEDLLLSRVGLGSSRASKFGKFVGNPMTLGVAGGLAGGIFSGVENLTQGKQAQAAGNLIGTAAGTAIGAALGGPVGAMIGGNIGNLIGEGFVNTVQNYKPEFSGLFKEAFKAAKEEETTTTSPKTEAQLKSIEQQQALDYVRKLTGSNGISNAITTAGYNAAGGIANIMNQLGGGQGTGFQGYSQEQAMLIQLGLARRNGNVSEDQYNTAIRMLGQANAPTATEVKNTQTKNEYQPLVDAIINKQSASLLSDLSKGQLGLAPYRTGKESLANLGAVGSQFYNAFGKESGMSAESTYGMTANVLSRLKPEQYADLTQMSQDIQDLDSKLKGLNSTDEDYKKTLDERTALVNRSADALKNLNQQVLAQKQLLQQSNLSEYSKSDAEKIVKKAQEMTQHDLQTQVDQSVISPEEMKAKIAELEDIIVEFSDDTSEKIKGTTTANIDAAISELEKLKEIESKKKSEGLGFQTFDLTSGEMNALVNGENSKYAQKKAQLEAVGYKADEQEQIGIFNDGVIQPMKKDWKIVQLLLQDILDVEQKQLDGMYNLPEGSSFWIPAQAAKLYPQNKGTEDVFKDVTAKGPVTETKTEEKPPYDPYTDQYRKYMDATQKGDQVAQKEIPYAGAEYTKPGLQDLSGEDPYRKYSSNVEKFRNADQASMDMYKEREQGASTGNNILDWLKSLFSMAQPTPTGVGNVGGAGPKIESAVPQFDFQNILQNLTTNLTTKLSLQIDNKTTVQLNGRDIAFAVKPYLKDDLVRYSNGAASKSVNTI